MVDKKRITLRLPEKLANELSVIAKKRGLSLNALIAEMAWSSLADFNRLLE